MCLILGNNYCRPWNKSRVRWKIFLKRGNSLMAPYYWFSFHKTEWNSTQKPFSFDGNRGFHVCLTRKDARIMKRYALSSKQCVIKKVLVDNFNASGYNSLSLFKNQRNETWFKLKIIN